MAPIYEFHCLECDKDFDSLMKPFEPVECSNCKARISSMYEGGKIVKRMSVTGNHTWGCSSDGAMPKGKSK